MAIKNEIWMDSGAMVSMIPEQDIFLDKFVSIAAASGGKRTITLNATFTGNFSLVTNLYAGCVLEIYVYTSDAFVDKSVIISNTATTITVSDTLATAITSTDDGNSGPGILYYGVISSFGAPVPAPKGSGSATTLGTATISTAGTLVLASQAIIENAAINTALSAVGSGGSTAAEIELTISPHSSDITMLVATSNGSNYQTGYITIYLASATGDSTLAIAFDTSAGTTKANSGFDDYVEVNIPDSATAVQIASAIQTVLAGKDVTVTRAGAVLSITNGTGGYVNSGTMMTMIDSVGAVTDFGTLSNDVDGGIVTAVTITNAGSSVTGTGNLTINSTGTDPIIALAATTAGNPRLLSDTWFGLVDTVTVPTTTVEMKQLNLAAAGTRNYVYQFKGAEATGDGSLSLSANNFSWLYFVLGNKAISSVTNEASQSMTNEQIMAGSVTGTNFIYDYSADSSNNIYRVEDTTVCPPIRKGVDNISTIKKLSPTVGDKLTYTFTESNGSSLPSFAMEYTLKKGSELTTVATDSAKEAVYTKIYPGCQVDSLTIQADEGQELKTTVNFKAKTTVVAPASYDTFNGVTDMQDFVNYGSRAGGAATVDEGLMAPYFFSDGVIQMFGNEYIRIQNATITISNGLQDKRYIGRYDKTSKVHLTGQRTYELSFTGFVTDGAIFDELRNDVSTALTTLSSDIILNFYKANGEETQLRFNNYMVKTADFPITNDNGPISVTWTIEPLRLGTTTTTTYWAIQG